MQNQNPYTPLLIINRRHVLNKNLIHGKNKSKLIIHMHFKLKMSNWSYILSCLYDKMRPYTHSFMIKNL